MEIENNICRDKCPLCCSSQIHKVKYADYGGKVKFSTSEIELCYPPEIWTCDVCSSGFTQNIISEATSRSLYSNSCAGQRWASTPFEVYKTPEVVRAMTDVFIDKPVVLDIGCNTGELLDFARTFGCVTSGVEYSDASRNLLCKKGHKPYQSLDDVSDQYDVITAFDLIEHLYDVPGFLNDCHTKLVDGGKLILLTGNIQSASAKAAGSHWWYAQYPEHIAFPSKIFFEHLNNYQIENWLPTYASVGYRYPRYRTLLSRLKRLVMMKKYNGLPSLSPDHALIVLTKKFI